MNDVSDSVENTAAYMQEISASINDLTGNIEEITKRYDNIDQIAIDMNNIVSEMQFTQSKNIPASSYEAGIFFTLESFYLLYL